MRRHNQRMLQEWYRTVRHGRSFMFSHWTDAQTAIPHSLMMVTWANLRKALGSSVYTQPILQMVEPGHRNIQQHAQDHRPRRGNRCCRGQVQLQSLRSDNLHAPPSELKPRGEQQAFHPGPSISCAIINFLHLHFQIGVSVFRYFCSENFQLKKNQLLVKS